MRLTKEILEQYGLMEREIKRIEDKIERYSHYQIPSEHGVVKGSMREYPFAEKHFVLSGSDVKSEDSLQDKLKQLLITLEQKHEEFLLFSADVGMAIEELDDVEMKELIDEKFIQRMTDNEIAQKHNLERSTVTKKFTKFFEKEAKKTA